MNLRKHQISFTLIQNSSPILWPLPPLPIFIQAPVRTAVDDFQRNPEIIWQVFLKADSACHAWYRLRLLHIRDGYVIEKTSGRSQGRGQLEAWFRWRREDAERVFSKIVHNKTKPNRSRVYRLSSTSTQLELFSTQH